MINVLIALAAVVLFELAIFGAMTLYNSVSIAIARRKQTKMVDRLVTAMENDPQAAAILGMQAAGYSPEIGLRDTEENLPLDTRSNTYL